MFIPLDEPDWFKFVIRMKKEGVKVQSRYRGVSITMSGNKPKFIAKYNGKSLGLFEMNFQGEEQARDKYIDFVKHVPSFDIGCNRGRIIKSKLNYHA
jgi:hypothetical protein